MINMTDDQIRETLGRIHIRLKSRFDYLCGVKKAMGKDWPQGSMDDTLLSLRTLAEYRAGLEKAIKWLSGYIESLPDGSDISVLAGLLLFIRRLIGGENG